MTNGSVSIFDNGVYAGLTKREYFAGFAMQGLASNHTLEVKEETIARWSVNCADALIAALNQSTEQKEN